MIQRKFIIIIKFYLFFFYLYKHTFFPTFFFALGSGGNLTAAVTLKILSHNQEIKTRSSLKVDEVPLSTIQVPAGLVLIYPALDFEMTCWMTPAQFSVLRSQSTTQMIRSKSLKSLLDTKDHLSHSSPLSMVPDVENASLWRRALGMTSTTSNATKKNTGNDSNPAAQRPTLVRKKSIVDHIQDMSQVQDAWGSARIAMTSRMCYFNDRIITADMVRRGGSLFIVILLRSLFIFDIELLTSNIFLYSFLSLLDACHGYS